MTCQPGKLLVGFPTRKTTYAPATAPPAGPRPCSTSSPPTAPGSLSAWPPPAWLYPAFGALTALYVAAPALEPGAASDLVTTLAVAATLLLVWAYPRLSGVRVSRTGASARLTLGLLLGATLLLLSTSLGLVALGLRWWTPLPAVASFALTVQLGRAFDRRYREHVRRGA